MNYEDNKIDLDRFHKAIAAIVTGANYDPRRDMHFIDPETIKNEIWADKGGFFLPKAITAICPHCYTPTAFVPEVLVVVSQTLTANINAECPVCAKVVNFFAVGCMQVTNQAVPSRRCKTIWMLPKPPEKRNKIISDSLVNPEIFGAYEESINLFNARFWRGSVTECGRALEGISHDIFKSKDLEIIASLGKGKEIDSSIPKALFIPIVKLTQAIRAGRTSGAHFNYTKPADKEIASKMLDLTEYALRYFYEMPSSLETIDLMVKHAELDT